MGNFKEVKNYLHNNLGLTKEYIDDIIIKTVQDEIKKFINNEEYVKNIIYNVIASEVKKDVFGHTGYIIHNMNDMIKDEITNTIIKEVKSKVEIKLKGDDNNA